MSVSTLHHDYEKSRFELYENGVMAGFLQYDTGRDTLFLKHTFIIPAHRGHGLAFALIERVLDDMHRRRLSIQPECPIVAEFLRTHQQYLGLVVTGRAATGRHLPAHEHRTA